MSLGKFGINRQQIKQGGGRGTGNDHVDELYGCVELFIYQTPNVRRKGFERLKAYLEAQGCQIVFTADAPPELSKYETMRVTHGKTAVIPDLVVKRAHSWAHSRNYLHSFFKPMYR